jgi:hypothetical protein
MNNLLAKDIGNPLRGIGVFGLEGSDAAAAPGLFNQIISMVLGLMTVIAGIFFVIQFFVGAIALIMSSGDKALLEAAQKKLRYAIIGLLVTIAAIFLARLIGSALGIDVLNPTLIFQ